MVMLNALVFVFVVDPLALNEEIEFLEENLIEIKGKLNIGPGCPILLPTHVLLDKAKESKNFNNIGTTVRGIGPVMKIKYQEEQH